jgi:PKHD-type hydroxylase
VQVPHNYYYYIKAISKEICEKIVAIGRNKILNPGTVLEPGGKKIIDKNLRDCKVIWINEPWIYELLNPYISEANEKAGWNFDIDWNQDMQYASYNKGHYFGWHSDQGATVYDTDNKNLKGKTRKISLTLQLTDPNNYEGGNLELKWFGRKGVEKIETIKDGRELGTIIIFPSFIWHRVTPITKGKRESLVNWSIGYPFK